MLNLDELWYDAILPAYGLTRASVLEFSPDCLRLEVGRTSACLWRTPMPPEEQAQLLPWEELLVDAGMCAPRLLANEGRAWVRVDERTWACLTAWDGAELASFRSAAEVRGVAELLARLRSLSGQQALPAPRQPGLGWADSYRERARRLGMFARLAGSRLKPTQFDLVYLAQCKYYQQQADRSVEELARAAEPLTPGMGYAEVNHHRLYARQAGLAFKTSLGLYLDLPVRSLYRLLARTLPRFDWSAETAAGILAAYHRLHPLAAAESGAILAGLRFPHAHYRLAHHYYLNHKAWPLRTFLRKQAQIWELERARTALLEELPLLLP